MNVIALPRVQTVAAFFDIDGTLIPQPSLERRLFARLRSRHAISANNYLLWLAHAIRLAPQGIAAITQANKMYLRGIRVDPAANGAFSCQEASVKANNVRCIRPSPRSLFSFIPESFERIVWHARHGHRIVLVSGTIMPLATPVAVSLGIQLALRGIINAGIDVCATRLEEVAGRWTGRILGEPVCGPAKARAIYQIAEEAGFNLERCYAYGDSAGDRWMLQLAGHPTVVNPSDHLARIAQREGWPVLVCGRVSAEKRHR
jgi:HAD superfamily hydrolase (TIGR01490 family)